MKIMHDMTPKAKNKYQSMDLKDNKKYVKAKSCEQFCINCGWYNKGKSVYTSNSICNCKESKFYRKETFARCSCKEWKQWNIK